MSEMLGKIKDKFLPGRTGKNAKVLNYYNFFGLSTNSFLFGGRYRYSPVSALCVFGRPQDVAFQRTRTSIHERNHARLWLAPIRFEHKFVWIGQISRYIGLFSGYQTSPQLFPMSGGWFGRCHRRDEIRKCLSQFASCPMKSCLFTLA